MADIYGDDTYPCPVKGCEELVNPQEAVDGLIDHLHELTESNGNGKLTIGGNISLPIESQGD